ncbi:Proto-oncogene tyrosine protein kinase FER [Entamoeba marina]
MSLSKESRTSSMGSRAQVQFPFELNPPIKKLTFGHLYGVQSVPLSETVIIRNRTNENYRMNISSSTSSKYTLEVNEEKLNIRKKVSNSNYNNNLKALIGSEQSELTLRFQMLGVIPLINPTEINWMVGDASPNIPNSITNEAPLTKESSFTKSKGICIKEDDKRKLRKDNTNDSSEKDMSFMAQFRKNLDDINKVGNITGKVVSVKGQKAYAYKLDDFETKVSKEQFNDLLNIYTDVHHDAIVGMIGLNFDSSILLLESDTQFNLEQTLETYSDNVPQWFLLKCCVNCATALSYLSSYSILHRNVKPNKLRYVRRSTFTHRGGPVVKLHDLSCAIRIKGNEKISEYVGTLEYMSPDVMQHEYDLKSDVYSLAMTIYHIFNTTKPYGEMTVAQIQDFVKNGNRLSPTDKIPIPIMAVITKCWNQNPDARPDYKYVIDALNEYARTFT